MDLHYGQMIGTEAVFNPRFAVSILVPIFNGRLWSDGSEAEAGFNPLISQAPIKKKRMSS